MGHINQNITDINICKLYMKETAEKLSFLWFNVKKNDINLKKLKYSTFNTQTLNVQTLLTYKNCEKLKR